MGQDWGVEDKLTLLNGMNAVEQMIIVGIYSADRMKEYTSPGYESYGRSVVEEIKPYIDSHFRTHPAAGDGRDGILTGRGRILLYGLAVAAGVCEA